MTTTETKAFWTKIRLQDRIADLQGEGMTQADAEIQAADEVLEDLFANARMRDFNAAIRGSDLLRAAYDRAMGNAAVPGATFDPFTGEYTMEVQG